jgi:hypothetical protein
MADDWSGPIGGVGDLLNSKQIAIRHIDGDRWA